MECWNDEKNQRAEVGDPHDLNDFNDLNAFNDASEWLMNSITPPVSEFVSQKWG